LADVTGKTLRGCDVCGAHSGCRNSSGERTEMALSVRQSKLIEPDDVSSADIPGIGNKVSEVEVAAGECVKL
jgi:hypothetical protein